MLFLSAATRSTLFLLSSVPEGHCGGSVDHNHVITLVFLLDFVEELLIDGVSRGTKGCRTDRCGTGVSRPVLVLVDGFPSCPITPIQDKVGFIEFTLHDFTARIRESNKDVV